MTTWKQRGDARQKGSAEAEGGAVPPQCWKYENKGRPRSGTF